MTRADRIADRAVGRDNNFNLLRMLAAAGVLVSHAWPISRGPGTAEPLSGVLNGITLGTVCVMVFFAISGFFITRSFDQRASLRSFLRARALRLFPALMVVLAVTVLVAGALLTTAPAATFWPAAAVYWLRNVTLFFLQYDLPGVFAANPYGGAINGSLWTLSYEVLCYGGVVACGLLGLLSRRGVFGAAALAFLAVYAGVLWLDLPLPLRLENLLLLTCPFLVGMVFWVWRAAVPLSGLAALCLLAATALLRGSPLFVLALSVTLPYAVFVLGFARNRLAARYNRVGDYSYGIYVYAFPLQQLVASQGGTDPWANIAVALPLTVICAVLSWQFVEEPALRLRHRSGQSATRPRQADPRKAG